MKHGHAGTVTARPLRATYVVAGGFLLLGVVGSLLALAIVLIGSVIRDMEPMMAGGVQAGGLLLVGFATFAFAGLGSLVLATHSWVSVGSDGRFRVRSWPPWRVREVDLHDLAHVASRQGPPRRHNMLLAPRSSTVLTLRDRSGAHVDWNPAFWRGSDAVAAALRNAVDASAAAVDPPAAAVLADPPYGAVA